MPASGAWEVRFERGKRKEASLGSGKGMRVERGSGRCGRDGKEIPRLSANISNSRAVITQSTSRIGVEEVECQAVSVSSPREASSFLSKQGIIAMCQIRSGVIFRRWLRTVLRRVPVRA